jgi:aldehyde:ferredoxin oxidoreductase
MVDKIIKREGFGDVLARNAKEARDKIGRGVEEVLNVKGEPIVTENMQNYKGRGLGAAISQRGGDWYRTHYLILAYLGQAGTEAEGEDITLHGINTMNMFEAQTALSIIKEAQAKQGRKDEDFTFDYLDYTALGEIAALSQKLINVMDSVGQCRWNTTYVNMGIGIEFQSRMLSAGEGRKRSIDELMEIGSRIAAQERAFSVKEGYTREHDTLPKRFFTTPLPGYFPDDVVDPVKFEEMKDEYTTRLWDGM